MRYSSQTLYKQVTVFIMRKLIFAAAISAVAFAGGCIPSAAADLGPGDGLGVRYTHRSHGWTGRWTWRDRCAYAGYYCLYAWDGYVYRYPFDDRPSALAYKWRRHRHTF